MVRFRLNDPKSRRKFLKDSGKVAGAILLTSMAGSVNGLLFATKEPKGDEPWYGIGIDIEKCIGCGNCVKACKIENDVPLEPFFFRTWVEQYTIKNDGTLVVESPNGGFDGFSQTVAEEDIFKSFFVPKMCNHCYNSPCEKACPTGASYRSPEGVVLIDEKYCIGCRYCIQACPYGCRYVHPVKKVVDKCTLCYHRITKGLNPACVANCPTGARIFGDLHDEEGELVAFLKEHYCHVLKPHLNTGSKLFYNGLSQEVR
jgi:tetrathionate reductase subunit B